MSVLTFDVYGTLIDRESGIVNALMPWLRDAGITPGRSEILRAFSLAERSHLVPGISYCEVLKRVHRAIAEFFGVAASRQAAEAFADSMGHWPVRSDARATLAYLKRHVRLIAVTNSDHTTFETTREALGVNFDAVYSAEDAGCFKPDLGMFAFLSDKLDALSIDRQRSMHVAGSIRFDHMPAKRLGMRTCWIYRNSSLSRLSTIKKDGVDVRPDCRFRTLGGLADAHWAEMRGTPEKDRLSA